MQRNKMGLLLAAAAAYGAYRYKKMSPQERTDLRTRGQDFLNKNLGGLKNLFNKKKVTTDGTGY